MLLNPNFSYSHYKDSLLKLKENHKFCFFNDIDEDDIILRHDIDISLNSALKMAELENGAGVKSTYFILIHSSFYNPFSSKSVKIIKKIINLGHKIGLHYDSKFILENEFEPNTIILKELELLTNYFKTNIEIISAHNPTTNPSMVLNFDEKFMDADSLVFKKNRKYLTDSVQNWREGSFSEYTNEKNLYVLVHPVWWTEENLRRDKILDRLENNDLDEHKKEVSELRIFYNNYLNMLKLKRKTDNQVKSS